MNRRNSKLYSFTLMLVDILVLIAAFSIAYIARVIFDPRPLVNEIYAFEFIFAFLLIVPFWIAVFALVGLYQEKTYNRRLLEWSKIAIGVFIGILLIIGWGYASEEPFFPARLVAVYALIGSFILIVLEREIMRFIRILSFRYGKGVRRVLLIGSTNIVGDIAFNLADTKHSGYKIVAIAGPKKYIGDIEHALHFSSPELPKESADYALGFRKGRFG